MGEKGQGQVSKQKRELWQRSARLNASQEKRIEAAEIGHSIPGELRALMGGAEPYPKGDNGETERRLIEVAQRGDKDAFGELMQHHLEKMYWWAFRELEVLELAACATEAEDVVQQVLLDLITRPIGRGKKKILVPSFRKLAQFSNAGGFQAWLRKTTWRKASKYFEHEYTTQRAARQGDVSYEHAAAAIESPEAEDNSLTYGTSEDAPDLGLAVYSSKTGGGAAVGVDELERAITDNSIGISELDYDEDTKTEIALARLLEKYPNQARDLHLFIKGKTPRQIALETGRKAGAVRKSIERARENARAAWTERFTYELTPDQQSLQAMMLDYPGKPLPGVRFNTHVKTIDGTPQQVAINCWIKPQLKAEKYDERYERSDEYRRKFIREAAHAALDTVPEAEQKTFRLWLEGNRPQAIAEQYGWLDNGAARVSEIVARVSGDIVKGMIAQGFKPRDDGRKQWSAGKLPDYQYTPSARGIFWDCPKGYDDASAGFRFVFKPNAEPENIEEVICWWHLLFVSDRIRWRDERQLFITQKPERAANLLWRDDWTYSDDTWKTRPLVYARPNEPTGFDFPGELHKRGDQFIHVKGREKTRRVKRFICVNGQRKRKPQDGISENLDTLFWSVRV